MKNTLPYKVHGVRSLKIVHFNFINIYSSVSIYQALFGGVLSKVIVVLQTIIVLYGLKAVL